MTPGSKESISTHSASEKAQEQKGVTRAARMEQLPGCIILAVIGLLLRRTLS